MYKVRHQMAPSSLRGGPLDILGGGGVSDPKKITQEIELEKKISCMRLNKEKKIRATSLKVRIYVEQCSGVYQFPHKIYCLIIVPLHIAISLMHS